MKDKIEKLIISPDASIKDALKRIDAGGLRTVFVCDDSGALVGSLTDGDIRRKILQTGDLQEPCATCLNPKPIFVEKGSYAISDVKDLMIEKVIAVIPVVDSGRRIVDILFLNDLLGEEHVPHRELNLPVVIMAGGKGTRLMPFTHILPKPLIPIGDRALIDVIMDRFGRHKVREFYISINQKSKMMKYYFEETNTKYKITYIEEDEPLGTAGSLTALKNKIDGSLIVSNCDILIDCDYREIADFHEQGDYDVTIVASFRHYTIPYGICEVHSGGELKCIREKPEYDFLANTGMYFLKGSTLDCIPDNTFFLMTDLIAAVTDRGGKVGVFPVSEKSWLDVGQWEEYRNTLKKLGQLGEQPL